MNRFCMAIILGFHVAFVVGCGTSLSSAKSCEFRHEGSGGVLNQNGGYINDSVLVWVDVAKNCFPYVNDTKGRIALNSWIDASQKFNTAMENGDEDEAFKMLHKANDSFKAVASFVTKPDLSMYFMQVYKELGALLEAKNLNDINDYMIAAYPQFNEKLGCKMMES